MHVDLIGTSRNSIIQQYTGVAALKNYVSLTCMKIIEPDMGCFEISKVLNFYLDNVTGGNYE